MLNFSINEEALKIIHRLAHVIYWLGVLFSLVILVFGLFEGVFISLPIALCVYFCCWIIRYVLSGEKKSVLACVSRYLFRKIKNRQEG